MARLGRGRPARPQVLRGWVDFAVAASEATADPAALILVGVDPAAAGTGAASVTTDPGILALSAVDASLKTSNLRQAGFIGRNDDGNLTTATATAAENTNWSQNTNTTFRIRFVLEETNGIAEATVLYPQLQYNRNGAGWNDVTDTSLVARSAASAVVANGATITNRLLTSGTGTFNAQGEFSSDNGLTSSDLAGAAAFGANELTEVEYSLQLRGADVVASDTVQFRMRGFFGDRILDTYSQTPTVTVTVSATNVTADPATLSLTGIDPAVAGSGAATVTTDPGIVTFSGVEVTAAAGAAAAAVARPIVVNQAVARAVVARRRQATAQFVDFGPPVTEAPALNITVDPGTLTLSGVDPTAAGSGAASVTADPAVITITGVDPGLAGTGTASRTVDVAVLVLSGIDVTVQAGANIGVEAAILTLTGIDVVTAGTGTAAIVAETATLTLTGVIPILTGVGTATATVDAAVIVFEGGDVAGFSGERVTPADRTYMVAVTPRTFVIAADLRTLTVPID